MFEQIVIALCGLISVWCSQDRRYHVARWACIAGLIGEPFWLYAAWKADQWGVIVLAFVYSAGWMRGFYNYWIKEKQWSLLSARS